MRYGRKLSAVTKGEIDFHSVEKLFVEATDRASWNKQVETHVELPERLYSSPCYRPCVHQRNRRSWNAASAYKSADTLADIRSF